MAAGIQNAECIVVDTQLMPEPFFEESYEQVQGWWSVAYTTSGRHFAGHSGFPADCSWEVVDPGQPLDEAGPFPSGGFH